MAGSNWNLEIWNSNVGFIRPWALRLQQLAFVVWFFQGSYKNPRKSGESAEG